MQNIEVGTIKLGFRVVEPQTIISKYKGLFTLGFQKLLILAVGYN